MIALICYVKNVYFFFKWPLKKLSKISPKMVLSLIAFDVYVMSIFFFQNNLQKIFTLF